MEKGKDSISNGISSHVPSRRAILDRISFGGVKELEEIYSD
jgi:hypothetical protein